MSVTHTLTSGHGGGNAQLADSVTLTGSNAPVDASLALSASTTNQLLAIGYLAADVKCVYLKSDVALTIKVDSSGSPEETISLAAGVPYTWCTGRPDACLLTTDVSVGWYLTCTLAANFVARVLT